MANALVVDDEEDIGDLVREGLEEFGLEVYVTTTGEDAIRSLADNDYKICIIDLKLSTSLSGLDVLRAIRDQRPKAVAVAMTGYVDISFKQEAENLGISDFLSKPDDLRSEVFNKKIGALLGK